MLAHGTYFGMFLCELTMMLFPKQTLVWAQHFIVCDLLGDLEHFCQKIVNACEHLSLVLQKKVTSLWQGNVKVSSKFIEIMHCDYDYWQIIQKLLRQFMQLLDGECWTDSATDQRCHHTSQKYLHQTKQDDTPMTHPD